MNTIKAFAVDILQAVNCVEIEITQKAATN